MNREPELFGDVLSDIAAGPTVTAQGGITAALMTRLHEKDMTLGQMGGAKIMARSERTMQKHARDLGLAFSDYVPMKLRKRVTLQQFGDFYECIGEQAEAVAAALGIVVTANRKGERMCGIPAHALEDYRGKLKAAWFIVKVIRAKKPRAKRST